VRFVVDLTSEGPGARSLPALRFMPWMADIVKEAGLGFAWAAVVECRCFRSRSRQRAVASLISMRIYQASENIDVVLAGGVAGSAGPADVSLRRSRLQHYHITGRKRPNSKPPLSIPTGSHQNGAKT
jgi:hypothetical protein